MLNNEVILKEILEDVKTDMYTIKNTDPDRLVKCEVISFGAKVDKDKFKVGDTVLVKHEALKEVKHELFKGLKILYSDVMVFCKL
jgi:hypothetical protein